MTLLMPARTRTPRKPPTGNDCTGWYRTPTARPSCSGSSASTSPGGLFAIAEALTTDGVPSPSAHDPGRNRHRCGLAWSKGAARTILSNPRYTGHQVWNKQRKDEVLIDVEDVALGHLTTMRWNNTDAWVWSTDPGHEALIDTGTFQRAQHVLANKIAHPRNVPTLIARWPPRSRPNEPRHTPPTAL